MHNLSERTACPLSLPDPELNGSNLLQEIVQLKSHRFKASPSGISEIITSFGYIEQQSIILTGIEVTGKASMQAVKKRQQFCGSERIE